MLLGCFKLIRQPISRWDASMHLGGAQRLSFEIFPESPKLKNKTSRKKAPELLINPLVAWSFPSLYNCERDSRLLQAVV